MLAKVMAAAQYGMEGRLVEIECDMSSGLPGLVVVGLGNKAIEEARDRIRSAIKNSSLLIPPKRMTFNLAPADLPKDGTSYDLGMAVALLITSEQLQTVSDALFIGELGLNGDIKPGFGAVTAARIAKRHKLKRLFLPSANAAEAVMVDGVEVYPVTNLKELFLHLTGEQPISKRRKRRVPLQAEPAFNLPDFGEIYGQSEAKQAMVVAAAGGHNILLTGPPGSGKTMLSKATLALLPPPSPDEQVEITQLHNLAGYLAPNLAARPFRSPHHTASNSALIGGGKFPRPGEISLSHRGVLFLDELPEFNRETLEALRQPLEDGVVTVARASGVVTFPARFMLVAAQNPCPCGFYGDNTQRCRCTAAALGSYKRKISGPLLDRIDIHIPVQRIDLTDKRSTTSTETSQVLRKRVEAARKIQSKRLGIGRTNADMDSREIERYCKLSPGVETLARQAARNLDFSTRAYMRIRKVARTLADLESHETITQSHFSEAFRYRSVP